jgi:hypothetical protein
MKKLKSIQGIPVEYIQSIFKIDLNSPSGLTWLPRQDISCHSKTWNTRYANKPAGSKCIDERHKDPRWNTMVFYNGKRHNLKCHRVIFLLHKGYLTKGKCIDHIDNIASNNNPDNLRELLQSQNVRNSKLSKINTSGYKGIYWHKATSKWRVMISINGKSHSFGLYVNKQEAIKVAIAARKKLHGEFGRDE